MKLIQRWKQTAIHNKALVITSVLMAFGTLFYTAVAICQFFLIKESGEHTDEQIARIIANANWLARSADYSEKQLESNVFQASQNAQNAISATQQQMRLDERAWVVLRGIGPGPQLDQPWTLSGVFSNTGKTPARNVSWYCVVEIGEGEGSLKWYRLAWQKPTLLAPNDQKECILHPTPLAKVNQELLDQLKNPKTKLFVYGASIYQDVFDKWHWLTFCQQLEPDGSAWDSCDKSNDTGDGKYPPPPFRGPPTMSSGDVIPVPR